MEIKTIGGKRYVYLVKSMRWNGGWKKIRKYVGEGSLAKKAAEKGKDVFEKSIVKREYIGEGQAKQIEEIRSRLNEYGKKGGKAANNRFMEWLFTELTYNSNAIEGTSLSLRETSMIINDNVVPKNASLREVNEAKNHREALEFLSYYGGDVNEKLILKLHGIIMKGMDDKRGKYRETGVFIIGSDVNLPHHSDVPKLMKNLVKWYKKNKNMHPLELAAMFSMKFVTIHPFTDGNGRISRLLMNYILKKNGYPEINIYVKDRNNYMKVVRKANDGNYEMIIDFLFRTLKKNYRFLYDDKSRQ